MVQGSDGARGEVLRCDNRPVNNPFAVNDTTLSYVSMNGQEVYKFAVKTVPKVIEKAVDKAGLKVEDIDLFVLHQANLRIIESVAKDCISRWKNFRRIWKNVAIFLQQAYRFYLIISINMV